MKKLALYYIFIGIILSVFVVGIFLILYGLYLYNRGRNWDKELLNLSYSDPEQYQAVENQRETISNYGVEHEKNDFTGLEMNQLADDELYGLFRQRYYKGRNFIIIGAILSFILIGIPILIYGFYEIVKSQQVKMELTRRGVVA